MKCPGLVLVPPNYGLYESCSAAFMEILRDYSDTVEQYSIDEAYVDMSASCHLFGTPEETAAGIKERIYETLGFTVNVGISDNKLLAKMASDFQKPDRVHTLYPEEIKEKSVPDLLYGGLLVMCKAGKGSKEIKDYIKKYENKYPNWHKCKTVKQLGKAKYLFLMAAKFRQVTVMKQFAIIHNRLIG